MKNLHKAAVFCAAAMTFAAAIGGCSNKDNGGGTRAQQTANVMGSPAPAAVQAQEKAMQAQQAAARQADAQKAQAAGQTKSAP